MRVQRSGAAESETSRVKLPKREATGTWPGCLTLSVVLWFRGRCQGMKWVPIGLVVFAGLSGCADVEPPGEYVMLVVRVADATNMPLWCCCDHGPTAQLNVTDRSIFAYDFKAKQLENASVMAWTKETYNGRPWECRPHRLAGFSDLPGRYTWRGMDGGELGFKVERRGDQAFVDGHAISVSEPYVTERSYVGKGHNQEVQNHALRFEWTTLGVWPSDKVVPGFVNGGRLVVFDNEAT